MFFGRPSLLIVSFWPRYERSCFDRTDRKAGKTNVGNELLSATGDGAEVVLLLMGLSVDMYCLCQGLRFRDLLRTAPVVIRDYIQKRGIRLGSADDSILRVALHERGEAPLQDQSVRRSARIR